MIARKNIFSTSEAAYAVDRDGRIVVWNPAAEQTFGYTESQALDQNCWELLSGRDVFGNRSCCEGCPVRNTAFNNEPISSFQIDFRTSAHGYKRFKVSTLMLLYDPGKELFVHICRPEADAKAQTAIKHATKHNTERRPLKSLTARETEVLTLLHEGLTIAEIADVLSISPSTVRNHTQHILLKLNAHSRFEAVALARKSDLI